MVTQIVRRLLWLPVAMFLIVGAVLLIGMSRPNMTIAYNGICNGRNGTCIYDAYTRRIRYHSEFVGASWTMNMRRAAETDQGSLFVSLPDGALIHKVVDNEQYFAAPQWSPDGKYILYEAAGRALAVPEYNLWLMDMLTMEHNLLLPLAGPTFGEKGKWSPDGKHLVYFLGEQLWLCKIHSATCELTALTDNPSASWSPDAKRVVFSPGANRVQILNGETGETLFREEIFPDSQDIALLGLMWLDNQTLIFTHSLDSTTYTLRTDDPTPQRISTENTTLAGFMAENSITMEAVVYHFGDFQPDLLEVQLFSPVSSVVPPSVFIGDNTGYYIGTVR